MESGIAHSPGDAGALRPGSPRRKLLQGAGLAGAAGVAGALLRSTSASAASTANPNIMYYAGSGGSADDLTPLQTAVTSWNTTYGEYPSLIVFSGIVCLSATWSPQQGINIAGAGYQLNRFSGLGGPDFVGAIIAPYTTTQSGPLIEFGTYGSGWGSSPYGEQPHITNLGFCGRQKGVSSNSSVPGLLAIAAEDVADGKIEQCSFEGFDQDATGSGGVLGGCVRVESSGTGSYTSEGWRIHSCQMVNSAYGVIFLGPNSTDCEIHDLHTNSVFFSVVLGLGSSDNAGGAILSDCHFVGGTHAVGSDLAGSSHSTEDFPTTKSHIYVGPGPAGSCNWRISNSYLDNPEDPSAIHVYINSLGAQIIGNYFLAGSNQNGPAFIACANTTTLSSHGPDCTIVANVFDQGSSATGSPGMWAMAQFNFLTLPSQPEVGIARNNRFRAGGSAMVDRVDTGVTVTNNSATVTDPSCKTTDLHALVNATHFPTGSYITSVTAGTSFVVSNEATSSSSQITIYPCPGIVDSAGNPFTLPQSNALGYFEQPTLPQ